MSQGSTFKSVSRFTLNIFMVGPWRPLTKSWTLFPVKLKWEHSGEWTAHCSFKKPNESDFYHLTLQHEQWVNGKQLISRFPSTPMEVDGWLTHKALHIYMHRELRWFVCFRLTLTDNVCVNGPSAQEVLTSSQRSLAVQTAQLADSSYTEKCWSVIDSVMS